MSIIEKYTPTNSGDLLGRHGVHITKWLNTYKQKSETFEELITIRKTMKRMDCIPCISTTYELSNVSKILGLPSFLDMDPEMQEKIVSLIGTINSTPNQWKKKTEKQKSGVYKDWKEYFSKKDPKPVSLVSKEKITMLRRYYGLLNGHNSSIKKGLIIYGDSGSGKTLSSMIIPKELGYNIVYIDPSTANSKADIQRLLDTVDGTKNILSITNILGAPEKHLILVDEVDSLSKDVINVIIQFINPLKGSKNIKKAVKENESNRWKVPVIFTTNDIANKTIRELVKECDQIETKIPPLDKTIQFVSTISIKEKLELEKQAIKNIVAYAASDIRKLLEILETCCRMDLKTVSQVQKYYNKTNQKKIDISLYSACRNILYNPVDYEMDEYKVLFDTERSLVPLLVHENIPTAVIHVTRDQDQDDPNIIIKQLEVIAKAYEDNSVSDLVETYIYSQQMWDGHHYQGSLGVVSPGVHLRRLTKETIPLEQGNYIKDGQKGSYPEVAFTSLLSSNSASYKRNKAMREIASKTPSIFRGGLDHFSESICSFQGYISSMLIGEHTETLLDFMILYDIGPEQVFDILKVEPYRKDPRKITKTSPGEPINILSPVYALSKPKLKELKELYEQRREEIYKEIMNKKREANRNKKEVSYREFDWSSGGLVTKKMSKEPKSKKKDKKDTKKTKQTKLF